MKTSKTTLQKPDVDGKKKRVSKEYALQHMNTQV